MVSELVYPRRLLVNLTDKEINSSKDLLEYIKELNKVIVEQHNCIIDITTVVNALIDENLTIDRRLNILKSLVDSNTFELASKSDVDHIHKLSDIIDDGLVKTTTSIGDPYEKD